MFFLSVSLLPKSNQYDEFFRASSVVSVTSPGFPLILLMQVLTPSAENFKLDHDCVPTPTPSETEFDITNIIFPIENRVRSKARRSGNTCPIIGYNGHCRIKQEKSYWISMQGDGNLTKAVGIPCKKCMEIRPASAWNSNR